MASQWLSILVAVALISQTQGTCVAETSFKQGFDQGTHELVLKSTAASFSVTIDSSKFPITPTAAISITKMDATTNSALNLQLKITLQSGKLTISALSVDMEWRLLRVIYWLNGLENLKIAMESFKGINPSKSLDKAINLAGLPKAFVDSKPKIAVFLAGIDASQMDSQNKQMSYIIGTLTGPLKVSVEAGSNTILNQISICYVLYLESNAEYVAGLYQYRFSNAQSLVYNTQLSANFVPTKYWLAGPSILTISSSEINYDISIDSNAILSLTAGSPVDDFMLSAFVIGVLPVHVCANCKEKLNDIQNCYTACPTNTYAKFNSVSSLTHCVVCSSKLNKEINSEKTDCQCKKGYNLQEGICVESSNNCPSDRILNPETGLCICPANEEALGSSAPCKCIANAVRIKGVCSICPSDTVLLNNQCAPKSTICKAQQQDKDGICKCVRGTVRVNDICLECRSDRFYDKATETCECFTNSVASSPDSICKCIDGTHMINNLCQFCPDGTKFDGSKCVQAIGICNNNEISTAGKCVCKDGFVKNGATCIACPKDRIADYHAQKCVCKANEEAASDSAQCKCIPNTFRINGICQRCPPNTLYNLGKGDCTPKPTSQNQCSQGQTLISSVCQCLPGRVRVEKVCKICPTDRIFDPKTSSCVCNINQYADSASSPCKCIPGTYKYRSQICENCPLKTAWNGTSCAPSSITCPIYETPAGSKCLCLAFYQRINGRCQRCYEDRLYDHKTEKCVCPPNQIAESFTTSCICTQNTVMVNGICKPCSSNAINGELKCTLTKPSTCGAGNYLGLDGRCAACMSNCQSCTQRLVCDACAADYYFDRNLGCTRSSANGIKLLAGYPQMTVPGIITDINFSSLNKLLSRADLTKLLKVDFNLTNANPVKVHMTQYTDKPNQVRFFFAYNNQPPVIPFKAAFRLFQDSGPQLIYVVQYSLSYLSTKADHSIALPKDILT